MNFKKIMNVALCMFFTTTLMAQNEGRIGIFAGMNNTSLKNADDKAFGDYLPTFKPSIGVEAAYHFTLFQTLASGISTEFSHTSLGQNYQGSYQDSTSYFAYSRLRYYRMGLGFFLGTPMRKSVAFYYSGGITLGFLASYQDRYELIRYNNARYIIDIKNTDVTITDTSVVKGTINNALYNKTDMTFYNKLGLDFLINERLVFGVYGRVDMGLSGVENLTKNAINTQTIPSSTTVYYPYNVKVKYRGPVQANIARSQTSNVYGGVYLSLHYRIYDRDKTEFWYKRKQN